MRPRRTSHMQALRQRRAASAWLPNEFTLYIKAKDREGAREKGVISNSLVETQSEAFHMKLILLQTHALILLLLCFLSLILHHVKATVQGK